MTPELDDQWKAAVMPIAFGVLDRYEFTQKGQSEARKRLDTLQVPLWAITTHWACTASMAYRHSPILPRFAIGCETALVGLWLTYTPRERLTPIYRAIFLRFLQGLMALFFTLIEASGDTARRQEYDL